MYRVAYDDWRKTENWFFKTKTNSEKKMNQICDELNITPIRINTIQPIGDWRVRWEKIITEEEKGKNKIFIN